MTSLNQVFALEMLNASGGGLGPVLSANTDLNVPAPGPDLSVTRTFGSSIVSRYQLGSFGYGWSFLWDDYAVTDSVTGDLIIEQNGTPAASRRKATGLIAGVFPMPRH